MKSLVEYINESFVVRSSRDIDKLVDFVKSLIEELIDENELKFKKEAIEFDKVGGGGRVLLINGYNPGLDINHNGELIIGSRRYHVDQRINEKELKAELKYLLEDIK